MPKKGYVFSKEHRRHLSEALNKQYAEGRVAWSKGLRVINSGQFKKGCTSWCKGLTKKQAPSLKGFKGPHSDESKAKMRLAKLGKHISPSTEFKKGHKESLEIKQKRSKALKGHPGYMKGKHHSEETKRKMSIAQKGKIRSQQHRQNLSKALRGRHLTTEMKERIRITNKKLWENPEYVMRMQALRKIRPNIAECKLGRLLQQACPNEYKFVGDFNFMLGGKNPDFMNINGQKKLIELYGTYFHNPKYFPERQSPEERIAHFKQYGFDTLIIWQDELEDEVKLTEKIKRFHNV